VLLDAPHDQRTTWPVHPAAELFPLLSDDELQELAEDIRTNGLHEPVWLYDDPEHGRMLLDGRNRSRACELAGVPVETRLYTGDDPIGFSISQNLQRRHLTTGQKAAVAVQAEPLYAAAAAREKSRALAEFNRAHPRWSGDPIVADLPQSDLSEKPLESPVESQPDLSARLPERIAQEVAARKSRERAASMAGTSGRAVQQYKRVAQQAPELAQKVQSGEMALDRADRMLRDREAAERRKERAEQTIAAAKGTYDLRAGDFRDVLADIPDGSVDLILTDPPYGDDATPIYGELAKFASRVLVDGGSLICYSGQSVLPDVMNQMTPHLRYWWTLALEHAHGGQQFPGKWVMVEWKPILWFVKDRRRGRQYVADRVRGSRPDKVAHEWAQGIAETFYVIEQLTEPGQLVVDPFAGSGAFGLAAVELGRNFIGSDLNPGSSVGQVVA
jgi:ParB-like chromosome segregation protein Spo0J